MMVFALSGKAYSGKDTAGKILVEDFGFVRYAFADALKDCALASDPYVMVNMAKVTSHSPFVRLSSLVQEVGWDEAKKEADVRRFLQRMGTEMGREIISPTVWIDIVCNKIMRDLPEKVVITDCRFANEVDGLRNMSINPHVVSIRLERKSASTIKAHSSEELSFRTERVIKNDGFISNLKESLKWLLFVEGQKLERLKRRSIDA